MVFSSPLFLTLFLPSCLILYAIVGARFRNYVVLLFSLVFYGWGEPRALVVMLLLVCVNYFIAIRIDDASTRKWSGYLLFSGILINISSLICYKYLSFLIININVVLHQLKFGGFTDPQIALPIGVSFYIFQLISYLIDVYRREVPPQRKFHDLALYVTMFPQLIAGPIVRYSTIQSTIDKRVLTIDNLYIGTHRFIVGLAKKVLIADTMALIADTVFRCDAQVLPCSIAWMGAFAYALQIYYEFSGYSDMAIGIGRVFNFRFLENFDFPYAATSIQEFWRRWHISLSTWFRDYLYIPLGGNRKGSLRTIANLIVVFVLCGLWHGAAWNFLVWGLFHGAGLVLERTGFSRILKRTPSLVCNLYVMLFVTVGWVVFRAETLTHAVQYLKVMFMGNTAHPLYTFRDALSFFTFSNLWLGIAGCVLAYPAIPRMIGSIRDRPIALLLAVTLFIVSFVFAMTSTFSPFIYFRF